MFKNFFCLEENKIIYPFVLQNKLNLFSSNFSESPWISKSKTSTLFLDSSSLFIIQMKQFFLNACIELINLMIKKLNLLVFLSVKGSL